MSKRDGSTFTWTSRDHALFTGKVLGALRACGLDAESFLTENEDYTATLKAEHNDHHYRIIVAEVDE